MEAKKELEQASEKGWISVKDRLPKVGEVVLTWDGVFKKHNVNKLVNPTGNSWDWGGNGITHWAPLLEPPKGE